MLSMTQQTTPTCLQHWLQDQEDHGGQQAGEAADLGHCGPGALPDHHQRCVCCACAWLL